MAKEFLTELEFDTAYRPAKPDHHYDGVVYYHKVKYAEGYKAEEAGIHQTKALDENQFKLDAQHGLAYLPAGEIPEEATNFDAEGMSFIRTAPIDGIMKEGQVVETFSDEKPKSKKSKSKKEAAVPAATKEEVPPTDNQQPVIE